MKRAKIFLVDDERTIRLTFRMALETAGFEVQEAATVEEANAGLGAGQHDLVILDLRIGDDSGLDVLAEMRRRGNRTPTLMITAYGSIRQAVQAMQLGAIDFLEKPIEPASLRRIVAEILDRHQPSTGAVESLSGVDGLAREAKRLINVQDFAAAARCLAAASKSEAPSPEIENLLGILAEIAGNYAEARRAYGRAIKLDATHEGAQQNMRRLFDLFNFGASQEAVHLGR